MSVITCVGDSQTDFAAGYGVRPSQCWPAVLARLLPGSTVRGFGISGETTTGLLARSDVLLTYEVPDLAVVYEGVNDPGASISQATTQSNLQAVIKGAKYGAVGAGFGAGLSVAGQANLPATGQSGQRYVVLADTSTTGGTAAWAPSQTATITGICPGGSGSQSVWEYRYGLAGEYGWGRVAVAATTPTACKRIAVVSTNYKNFTTGGDTPATPEPTYATVRAAQQAAATAESVVYVDLYAFQKARIVAGTDLDFSAVAYDQTRSWHYTLNNQHHNTYGHQLVAQAVLAGLPSAWVTALTA